MLKKIGIDIHSADNCNDGNGVYIYNLIKNVIILKPEYQYYLFYGKSSNPCCIEYSNISNVTCIKVPHKSSFMRYCTIGFYSFTLKLHILHTQYFAPLIFRGKLIVTIHDTFFHQNPLLMKRSLRLLMNLFVPLSMFLSRNIITVSFFSYKEIVKYIPKCSHKVVVIHNGPGNILTVNNNDTSLHLQNDINNYFLYVGRLSERKNILSIINSFLFFNNEKNNKYQLLLVGKFDYTNKTKQSCIESLIDNKIIHHYPYSDVSDLTIIYKNALALVYPSLYEGFGFPCIEALSIGCPVITTSSGALPEILSDAVIYVSPENVYEIAQAMQLICNDHNMKKNLIKRGRMQSKKFTWAKCALETLRVYENA